MSPGSHGPTGVSSRMVRSIDAAILRTLRDIVGRDHVITDPDRLVVYESDGLTAYRVSPAAVVLPGSTEEVASVVALLHGAGIPVVPRGAGTGLSGGALPISEGVVVGTARMNHILSIDPVDRLARVQPGVINARLTEAARAHGLYYAPDPSSQSTCTLGGNAAEWMHDRYAIEVSSGFDVLVDPLGPAVGELHSIRGSSYLHGDVGNLRLTFRDNGSDARDDVGFRLARYAD